MPIARFTMVPQTFGQNFPLQSTEAVASAAVRQYAPAFLDRGGPVNRAFSERSKGRTPRVAAAIAAQQGKGHVGELRQSIEQTLASALLDQPYRSRPNPVANDPQIDIEVLHGRCRVNGAQVGVGSPKYLRAKVRKSRAPQVVVNTEAREQFRLDGDPAYLRSSDRLRHCQTEARPLRGEQVEREATVVLESVLLGSPAVPEMFKLAVAATAGVKSAASSFSRSLLIGLVERLYTGKPIDESIVTDAIRVGTDAFCKSSVQSYFLTSQFLEVAGTAYDSRLIRKLGGHVVVAGAIAEVVLETAKDVVAWSRGKLTFEQVLRRCGVAICASTGGVAGWMISARLSAGLGPWGALAITLFGTWAGAKLGEWLGTELFLSPLLGVRRSDALGTATD